MIVNQEIFLEIQGPKFEPRVAESVLDVQFTESEQLGEIQRTGRYRNEPIPFGWARLLITLDDARGAIVRARSSYDYLLPNFVRELKQYGAETLTVHFEVEYQGQCNLEITPVLLSSLAEAKVPLTISCWETP